MVNEASIRDRFAAFGDGLNERSRRLFAAAEANRWARRDRRGVPGNRDRTQHYRARVEGTG